MAKTGYRPPLLGFLILLLTGCGPSSPPPYTVTSQAYGEPLQLTIAGLPDTEKESAANTALSDLHFIQEVSNPWHPGPLARTNQLLALEGEFSANPSVLPLIRRAGPLAQASNGYFNPALGKLRELWGVQHNRLKYRTFPESDTVESLLSASPTLQDVEINGIRMKGNNPALLIDFGPFSQGFAVDTAMLRLREAGVTYARIENGPFTSLFSQNDTQTTHVDVALLENSALSLSLTGGESIVALDSREHAFVNPKTGQPLLQPAIAVVIAGSAAEAAAAAEALLHAPDEEAPLILQQLRIEHALLKRPALPARVTPAMRSRLQGANELECALMVNGQ